MEIASYSANPRSVVDTHRLHTIKRNLTRSALELDKQAVAFKVTISHKKGWFDGPEQPSSYPLEVDLIDRDRTSLLTYYHDFEPDKYRQLAPKLRALVEQYLDAQDYSVGVFTSARALETSTSAAPDGLIPRSWLRKVIPRMDGLSVTLGGEPSVMEASFGSDARRGTEGGRSEYSLLVKPRRTLADPKDWELACDISATVHEAASDTQVYPELAHFTNTYRAIQEAVTAHLVELFDRGAVVCNQSPPADWGFVETDYPGLYVLSWTNRKLTTPSGGAAAFADRILRTVAGDGKTCLLPLQCPDNNHTRHFVSRALLQMGYPAPTFHRDRVFVRASSQQEAARVASVVQIFSAGAGGLYGADLRVNTIACVNTEAPSAFLDSTPDQKSAYLSLDSEEIYVYSVAEIPAYRQ